MGFSGGNNKSILPVLRHLKVIDTNSGAPTEYWKALRSKDKAKFADAVRKGYPELFATYENAHKQDAATLQTFFRTHTGLGEKAQSFCVRTFQVLVEFGDFDEPTPAKSEVKQAAKEKEQSLDLGDDEDAGKGFASKRTQRQGSGGGESQVADREPADPASALS